MVGMAFVLGQDYRMLKIYTPIYTIHPPNSGLRIPVFAREREQSRF